MEDMRGRLDCKHFTGNLVKGQEKKSKEGNCRKGKVYKGYDLKIENCIRSHGAEAKGDEDQKKSWENLLFNMLEIVKKSV